LKTFFLRSIIPVSFAALAVVTAIAQEAADPEPMPELPYPIQDIEPYAYGRRTGSGASMSLGAPPNLRTEIIYNPATNEYEVTEKVGAFETYPGYSMSLNEYIDYYSDQSRSDFWRNRAQAARTGQDADFGDGLQFEDEKHDRLFGSDLIEIKPQGSAELQFGVKRTTNRNSSLTRKQQTNTSFDFTNKIQVAVTGTVGDKVKMTLKYDTDAQFEFENEMKLSYEGEEDDIIQLIELGNVSFPSNNSLITGSQSLFGIKSQLQFGKMHITGVLSQQKGQLSSIETKGGARTEEFEIRAVDYEESQHFFLAQVFRERYSDALADLPIINSEAIIRKVEVWISQTSTSMNDARDIIAFTNLGDVKGGRGIDREYTYTKRNSDPLYRRALSALTSRDINTASVMLENQGLRESVDFERFERAELMNPSQYEINYELGFITFRSRIARERSIGVAIEYEYNGVIYHIGEFSSEENTGKPLAVKLLKGRRMSPEMGNWNLMMRNVYNTGGRQLDPKSFYMEVLYEDDRTGVPVNYLSTGPESVRGISLLELLGYDKINQNNEPYEDGVYDFVDKVTIFQQNGRIFLPALQPFGRDLESRLNEDKEAIDKYVYNELYDSTKVIARQFASKNKFILKGNFESAGGGSIIRLNTMQVKPESVKVYAGAMLLTEGQDYILRPEMGEVEITNLGLLESGATIKVDFESDPLFSFGTKTMMGTRMEYRFSNKFFLAGTVLQYKERPNMSKVGFDDFPVQNTMWGLDGTYSTSSQFLTRAVDAIPLINTKQESKISLRGEFAQLVPGVPKNIVQAVEIDYFENAQRRFSIKNASEWHLGGTPKGTRMFPEASRINDPSYAYRRAQIAWYEINTKFYDQNEKMASKDEISDPFAFAVYKNELFPNYQTGDNYLSPMPIMNLAYYPAERGPYNFNVDGLDPANGRLLRPEESYGSIMRALRSTDFDEANIEYLEFWMMNPFHGDEAGMHRGGDLYINLGDISEDILPDGRKSAETGLINEADKYDETEWGRVPNFFVFDDRFDNNIARNKQDMGLNGLSSKDEQSFYYSYLERIRSHIANPQAVQAIENDPAADDFKSYNARSGSITERYRYVNRPEGNSPSGGNSGNIKDRPESEDINGNSTLDLLEDYYEYRLSLRPSDMVIGSNFIADSIVQTKRMPNNTTEQIVWYQIKIPIRTPHKRSVGTISSFQNIQFMRLYLTNFADSVVLRFAEMNFVTSTWRKYNQAMFEPGEYDVFNDSDFEISVANIEENSNRAPVNYVLPPGVDRSVDPMNETMRELNEQALELKIIGLDDGNSRAIFKDVNRDYRPFGRIKMFAHAEALPGDSQLKDGDLYAFIRIGSDYSNNYYEYEVPLKVTDPAPSEGYSNSSEFDRLKVWPEANNFDIELQKWIELKLERNSLIAKGESLDQSEIFYGRDGANRIAVKGNPNISNVRVVMLGVRNRKKTAGSPSDDGMPKSAIIWFNELMLTDFQDNGGWAATAQLNTSLADFATVSLSGKTAKPGFGSIDQRMFNRSNDDLYNYDVGANVSLNKFFPDKLGLSIPFYTGVSETFIIPKYDPTNPDLLMAQSLDAMDQDYQRDSLRKISIDYSKRYGYNFTNVRMNPEWSKNYPWSIKNFSTTYAYTRNYSRNVRTINDTERNHKAAFYYNYVLKPEPFEPFKGIKNKNLKIISDFNIYYLPMSVSFLNDWDKGYRETMRRNLFLPDSLAKETYIKNFDWKRTYKVNYNFSRQLKFDYSAVNDSKIHEPQGKIDKSSDGYDAYRSDVTDSLRRFGITTNYDQKVNANYRLPINKIPQLSWVTSNYRYGGNYNWERGVEIRDRDDILKGRETYPFYGHKIKNNNSQSIDGAFNMRTLYGLNKYLKEVDRKYSRGRQKTENRTSTQNVRYSRENLRLQEGKTITINHRLGTEDVKLNIVDGTGALVRGNTEIAGKNKVLFTPAASHDNARIVVNGRKTTEETDITILRDRLVYTAMMVKTINITYQWNNGSIVPHYIKYTKNMGLDNALQSRANPGWDYVIGIVPSDEEMLNRADKYDWFGINNTGSDEYEIYKAYQRREIYTRTYSNKLMLKSMLEPISELRVNLDAERSYSHNYGRNIADRDIVSGEILSKGMEHGSFSISTNTMASAFNSDAAYQKFRENRLQIAQRLNAGADVELDPDHLFPNGYSPTSQDVMIPAFVAAYTGQDADKVYMDSYFRPMFSSFSDFMRSINWNVQYSGLTKLEPVKAIFRRVTLSHGYNSSYAIGKYESNSYELDEDGRFTNPVTSDVLMAPEYSISNVSISERFSPIFGVSTTWQNNLDTRFEVAKTRTVGLSVVRAEIAENHSFEYKIGAGYTVKNFAINMNTANGRRTFENDLKLRADLSMRNATAKNRNIIRDVTQEISGQKTYTLRSSAEYQLTERFTSRLILDYSSNKPLVGGNKTSNFYFGINLRFSLA
jgi:cell surface protein SprA